MSKPRFKDDDGGWVYAGDTIMFHAGTIMVTSKIMNRSGTLWVLPDNPRIEGCPLRALRGYVGAWWKEES